MLTNHFHLHKIRPIENGKKVSHFTGLTSTKNIDKINLKELVIHVKYLKRDQYSKLQNLKHKKWWINYFQLSNATAIGWENW